MTLSLIVAMSKNGVIGRDGDLPWRLSADLRRFKRLTMGHHLVVGRRTWESIGRQLPGRTMIVVTRSQPEVPDGVLLAGSLNEAIELSLAAGDDEVYVAGGGTIYALALPVSDRLYLTRVHASRDRSPSPTGRSAASASPSLNHRGNGRPRAARENRMWATS